MRVRRKNKKETVADCRRGCSLRGDIEHVCGGDGVHERVLDISFSFLVTKVSLVGRMVFKKNGV